MKSYVAKLPKVFFLGSAADNIEPMSLGFKSNILCAVLLFWEKHRVWINLYNGKVPLNNHICSGSKIYRSYEIKFMKLNHF